MLIEKEFGHDQFFRTSFLRNSELEDFWISSFIKKGILFMSGWEIGSLDFCVLEF